MKVSIIGGGRGGYSILKSLEKMGHIEIVGVVDVNIDAPAIALAKKLSINFGTSIEEMLAKETDLIIEVTGSKEVLDEINIHNIHRAEVISSTGAKLMTILVSNEERLNKKLEVQMGEIRNIGHVTKDSVDNMHKSIEQTTNLSGKLNDFIDKTLKHVEESDQIIQLINKITSQTNILGLNASIEAARAGQYGSGFAVVAKEIQTLARSSEESTKKITEILEKINSEVSTIHKEVDQLNEITGTQEQVGIELEKVVSQLVASLE